MLTIFPTSVRAGETFHIRVDAPKGSILKYEGGGVLGYVAAGSGASTFPFTLHTAGTYTWALQSSTGKRAKVYATATVTVNPL